MSKFYNTNKDNQAQQNKVTKSYNLKDIKNHWAFKYIEYAAENGWIEGYEDGKFKPDSNITRAELVTMINNMLDRKVKKDNILINIKDFTNLDSDKWYYEAIIEASNTYLYNIERLEDDREKWIEVVEEK